MFTPKTKKISDLHNHHSKGVAQLESMLTGKVYVYIDFAKCSWLVQSDSDGILI